MDKFILAIFILISPVFGESNIEDPIVFSYDPDSIYGPHHWSDKYPDCGLNRQSPINIDLKCLNNGIFRLQLRLEGLDTPVEKVEMANVALTARSRLFYKKNQPYLYGGPLSSTYLLDSIHCHWGILDNDGSEHSLNGQKYPMEMHFVFFNKAYQNYSNALSYSDGYAVIGVFFEVSDFAPDLKFFDLVKKVKQEGKTEFLPGSKIDLREIMPDNFIYACYLGSFTTPPCSEIVNWIVSTKIMKINPKQMSNLRELYDKKTRPLAFNYRDIQPTNDRRILKGIINNQ